METTPHLQRSLVWLRRDLRLEDNTALSQALRASKAVFLVFVFDTKIIGSLDNDDRRLTFIYDSLLVLDTSLQKHQSRIIVQIGDPTKLIPKLAHALDVDAVYANRDYEPYAKTRDAEVKKLLGAIPFFDFKDQVIFEGREILSGSGAPYKVFTPYKNAWRKALSRAETDERKPLLHRLAPTHRIDIQPLDWSLDTLGFSRQALWLTPGSNAAKARLKEFSAKIKHYKAHRDFPAEDGTSGLSVHLRFGTISVRACVRLALEDKSPGAQTWLDEIIWRDFYQMILDQFPHVTSGAFKREWDQFQWPGSTKHFESWSNGETGFPIIDAAMKYFQQTGSMHNRLRMIVASFLTKDLLCDWRWGETFFAKHLLDYDLSANNGGWQWSASTGCDAQPYFRIFNPTTQSERFDPDGVFIGKVIPNLQNLSAKEIHSPQGSLFLKYPSPIVDHKQQREKALRLFSEFKKSYE
jgi:deoxyribodipyrimidine photo-lyase